MERQPDLARRSEPDSRWTPLSFAAAAGFRPLVQLLIDRGADADAIDAAGSTALDVSRALGRTEVAAYLAERTTVTREARPPKIEDELFSLVRDNDLNGVKALLESGVDCDARDSVGATPLMTAALCGHYDVTKALVEKIPIENIPPEYGGQSMPLGQSPEETMFREKMQVQTWNRDRHEHED